MSKDFSRDDKFRQSIKRKLNSKDGQPVAPRDDAGEVPAPETGDQPSAQGQGQGGKRGPRPPR